MYDLFLLIVCLICAVFIILTVFSLAEEKWISFACFAGGLLLVGYILFGKILSNNKLPSNYNIPHSYKIDEENDIGYFYWKDIAVKTQDYKLLKSPQDVVVEEVRSFQGFGVITNSLPVVYRATLKKVEN